jgi:hypothetical protein
MGDLMSFKEWLKEVRYKQVLKSIEMRIKLIKIAKLYIKQKKKEIDLLKLEKYLLEIKRPNWA